MAKPRKKSGGVAIKQLPWQLQLLLDIVMLRSTPITAVFWCGFLLVMAFHVAYACSWLPQWTGLDQGFVRVSDLSKADQQREQRIAGVERKIDWELKLTLTREIRDASMALCKSHNPGERQGLQNYIDSLIEEYARVSGKTLTQPPCPHP